MVTTTTSTTTSIIAMLLRATTGTTMDFTSSKSETILTLTSKSLDGTSKRAELSRTSKLTSSDLDSSILPDLSLTHGDHSNPSLVPLQWEFKALSNTSLLPLRTLSMITWTKATRDTLKKETILQELFQTYVIITAKSKTGADMSLTSLMDVEKLFSPLPTQGNLTSDPPIDDSRKPLFAYNSIKPLFLQLSMLILTLYICISFLWFYPYALYIFISRIIFLLSFEANTSKR